MSTIGATKLDLIRFKALILSGSMSLSASDRVIVDGEHYRWTGSAFALVADVQGDEDGEAPLTASELATFRASVSGGGILRRQVLAPALWPSAAASPASVATSGPGGASPITGTLVRYLYNSPQLSLLGCVPLYTTALGADYYANNSAGVIGSGATPWAVEFSHYGADLQIQFRNAVGNGSFFWIWASDPDTGELRPHSALPVASSANSANSLFFYRITFGTTAQRVVRVYMSGCDLSSIDMPVTNAAFKSSKPARSLCIISDSYGGAAGATSALTGFATTVGRLLDVETYLNVWGGTGYCQGSTTNSFLAPVRVAAAIASGATDFLVYGSINDQSFTPAQVTAAATSLVSQLRAGVPGCRVWAAGVQACGPTAAATGNNIANNTALAALYASLGVPFIDETAAAWFTGTGRVGATAGNGNRDIFCSPDGIHPAQAGYDYIASRQFAALIALGWRN